MSELIDFFNMINELVSDGLIKHEVDYKQINGGKFLAIKFNNIYGILKEKHKNSLIFKFRCSSIKKFVSKQSYCVSSNKVVKMRDAETLKFKPERVMVIDIDDLEKNGAKLTNLYLK